MKTLANCTPREFLVQTNRIRIAVEKWLNDTKILEIRERRPELPELKKPKNKEELEVNKELSDKALAEQIRKNAFDMLGAMLDDNLDETLTLLALVCFIEPEDIDKYTMSELLGGITEVLNDESVIGFFVSLVKLAG